MKSLENLSDKAELLVRLNKLSPNAERQWGKMNVNQMLCHLSDSFQAVMGEKKINRVDNFITRTFVKWVALKTSLPWPKGVKTRPELDQQIAGTKPQNFDSDRQTLLLWTEKFSSVTKDFKFTPHPIFGEMTYSEWQRWGYLHIDHHLRQFNG
jgi:hypothetical protein